MHAANDNHGINWAAPVVPSLRDLLDSIILYKANDAANDNLIGRMPRAEMFALLGEGKPLL
jgi:hypothetical protein